jgi:Conjugal transfer protein
MNRTVIIVALVIPNLMGQKIEKQQPDPQAIVRVETARDHLSVIELSDPVTMVAVGNQNAFTIERRENKVFVKPIEDGASTNLFIWTTQGRYAYELVPAGAVEQMHFAIDQKATVVSKSLEKQAPEKSLAQKDTGEKADPLPTEMLTEGRPILVYGERETRGRVEVSMRELYEKGNRLYVRYAVVNQSTKPYRPCLPNVSQLTGIRAPQSLIALGDRQLGERFARSLKVKHSAPLGVIDGSEIAPVAPGANSLGWVVLEQPKARGEAPALRFQFAADTRGPVDAVLVLRPCENREKVAHARPELPARND